MNLPQYSFEEKTAYLIGAGSGDIRHLTIEAHSILSQADLILYDMYLEALNPYYPQAVWESVGKKKGFHVKKQSEIMNYC